MNSEEDETDKSSNKENSLPGYSYYSENEDIYNKEQKAPNINPDDDSEITEPNDGVGIRNEKNDDQGGGDLDVPCSEWMIWTKQ